MVNDGLASTRNQWEQRAAQSGKHLSGVLFRGFSEQANASMHRWHEWVVSESFLPRLVNGARVLDLGCGYGRLSKTIRARRGDVDLVGQDVSFAYCKLFHDGVGGCVQADGCRLPFTTGAFDAVMAVTCLMYGPRASVPGQMEDIQRVLRPHGTLLLLDPGYELQRLIAAATFKGKRSPTGGRGFSMAEYPALVSNSGFRIRAMGGNPWLSTALLVPGVARSNRPLVGNLLEHNVRKDCRESGFSRLALHRWIIASREG
jgi:SAM-dependent methyltransferase